MHGNAFRISFYLTLALATLCLGVAETFFLPWAPLLVLVAWGIFYLAYRCEGRWTLSEQAANSVGLVIAFLMLGWIATRLPRTDEELLSQGVPWPAGLLPHLGPLLMLLTLAKVFRPKSPSDFWVLQALGLMMVTLASVLAGEFHHAVWLLFYLVSFFWCLALHYRVRGSQSGESALFAPTDGPLLRSSGLPGAALLACIAFVFGLGAFYVAPRHPANQWIPYKLSGAAALGLSATGLDTNLDLNHVGKVELSEEIAFDVTPQDSSGERPALPESLYWRTDTVEFYRAGRWVSASQTPELWPDNLPFDAAPHPLSLRSAEDPAHPGAESPKDMAAGHLYLQFHLRALPSSGLIFAERPDPALGLVLAPHFGHRPAKSALAALYDGTDTIIAVLPTRRGSLSYGQIWEPAARSGPRRAGRIHPMYRSTFLLQTPPDAIVPWTQELLTRVGDLNGAERTLDALGRVARANRAAVAQALTRHFGESGEYLYSLNLRRQNARIDPVVDFLMNVKDGHCERYASGLAIVLRAVGIPCRLVQGFRGGERDEEGVIHVRFAHAHSWVEALVPDGSGGEQWITLDPTPSLEAPLGGWQAWQEWAMSNLGQARRAFRRGILEYGNEEQADTFQVLRDRLRELGPPTAIGLGVATPLVVALVWFRRRRRLESLGVNLPWMRAFLRLANDRPRADQTWTEFIADLREKWSPRLPAEVTDSIGQFGERYDQVRFGAAPLTATQEAELVAILTRLRLALRG